MNRLFVLLVMVIVTPAHADTCLDVEMVEAFRHIAPQRDGILIPADAVAGYRGSLNGDLHPLGPPGIFLSIIRLVREGSYKEFTGKGLRGYELKGDYISDLGMVHVDLNNRKYEFLGILSATQFKLEEHLARVESATGDKNSTKSLVVRDLKGILNSPNKIIPSEYILEDPRFMEAKDGSLYVFVTAVAKFTTPELDAGQYKMAALKVKITGNRDNPLQVESFQLFGLSGNKDTGFFPLNATLQIQQEIRNIYRHLNLPVPNNISSQDAIMMLTRVNGAIQMIPFPNLQSALTLSEHKYQEIYQNQLHRTAFEPDRKFYRSVGNNDQVIPLKGLVPNAHNLLLHMFHVTEAQEFDPQRPDLPTLRYSTTAALLNTEGDVVAVSPVPLQSPRTDYEIYGDVNWVVFNSGNGIITNERGQHELVLYNGVADSAIATARMPLVPLVEFLMKFGKVTSYNRRTGIVIAEPLIE